MTQGLPQHVAFILDGNRRWARAQGVSALVGHMKGMEVLVDIVKWCAEKKIPYLTAYAFSVENWERPQDELDYLFNQVFDKAFRHHFKELIKNNVKINVFGDISKFPENVQEGVRSISEESRDNTGLVFNVCLNYGGRAEVTRAVKEIVKEGIPPDQISEEVVSDHLYSAGMPEPDLLIRTGGEQRISGFLLWQLAYTELYFPAVGLPGFTKEKFEEALEWYASRDRRHGR